MDYKEATDDPVGTVNPKTYNIFKPENEPTPAQAVFYKTPLPTSRQPPVMDTIFEGVMINQANINFFPQKPACSRRKEKGTSRIQLRTQGTGWPNKILWLEVWITNIHIVTKARRGVTKMTIYSLLLQCTVLA